MSRNVWGVAGAMLLTTTMLAAQERPSAPQTPPPRSDAQEVTFTGCVVAGNSAGTYLLDNALERLGSNEPPRAFRLVGAAEDLDFMSHLNHRVQVIGTADRRQMPSAPPGEKIAERDLPLLSVKTIKDLADTCAG